MKTFAAIALGLVACGGSPAGTEPVPADVSAAPLQATVSGTPVTVTAYAWRNMMPGDGSLDRRLAVSLTLHPVNGTRWPANTSVQRAWVIRNDQAWVASEFETQNTGGNDLQVVTRGGPLWPVGDAVEVVVELRDANGAMVKLKSTRVTIEGPV